MKCATNHRHKARHKVAKRDKTSFMNSPICHKSSKQTFLWDKENFSVFFSLKFK